MKPNEPVIPGQPGPPKQMNIAMNVRTYIATAALQAVIGAAGMAANSVANIFSGNEDMAKQLIAKALDKGEIARDAVAHADALIAELTKPVGDKQ